MQALIAGLLEYSRVGRQVMQRPVSAQIAFDRALANLRSVIAETGAAVSCAALPGVIADSGDLTQVFQNLLGNAMKFRRPAAPPRIDVSASVAGNECTFVVSDNGIGVDPRHADRIFAIFQRLHTRGEYPGTGIGLAICKKVVERHRGRIWVESRPGQGAAFYFTLPAAVRIPGI